MARIRSSVSAVTSRVLRRSSNGWTQLEVILSIAIFSLILVISFLPFKMTNASMQQGTALIDRLENVRTEFAYMIKDIRGGTSVTLSSPTTLSSGTTAYRTITFTNSSGVQISYSWQALNSTTPTTEWTIVRNQMLNGTSQSGYPKTVIPCGVYDFWFQSIPAPGQQLSSNNDSTSILTYILVYPDDAARPLPDAAKSPIELGTSVTLRNN